MSTTMLRYVGPFDEVEIPDVGTVKRNHQFEVDEQVAGKGPRTVDGELVPGEGLLAQPDNFERVAKKRAETSSKES